MKYLATILLLIFSFFFGISSVSASSPSFVSIVNPVRGNDFWELKNQTPIEAVLGQNEILRQANLPATWLVRFDALNDPEIVKTLKSFPGIYELGMFLEVTPTWANAAGVSYRSSSDWHLAGSAFLTGYAATDREKLIDTYFSEFQEVFGFYPRSVGAWYIDSHSLGYMKKKYDVTGVLIVADQHTTDSYQVWGQFWSTPYYPSNKNTLMPAQNKNEGLDVVVMQWAARDPVNGYGRGVEDSTYSVQANDYLDYHQLDSKYFSKLIDIYTTQKFNRFGQIVVGLENSYIWKNYQDEYRNQINLISEKSNNKQLQILTMGDFSQWYKKEFTDISPTQIIVAPDPLGSDHFAVWFMNPYYRAGWFYNKEGSVFRDVRPYNQGREEQCFREICDQLSFATFALWTIDEVTRNQRLVLDSGIIKDIKVVKEGGNYLLTYQSEAGRKRKIEFMPRDISVDGKVTSIDSFILDAIKDSQNIQDKNTYPESAIKIPQQTFLGFLGMFFKFLLFATVALFIPGFVMIGQLKEEGLLVKIFLSLSLGFVGLTLISYIAGYTKMPWAIYLYLIMAAVIFIVRRYYRYLHADIKQVKLTKFSLLVFVLIAVGTVFQSLSMIRSGWIYDFGIGFWGPLGHDGIWHQALINQLITKFPPENPGFSGTTLSNYHYFYDLLVATTFSLSTIPVTDLLYRFYPVLFSILTGVGSYFLIMKLFGNRIAALTSLYFIYFAGSFGWIVEYIRERHIGGESAFWANQPVSANLNPPFAISLVLLVAFLSFFLIFYARRSLLIGVALILIAGSLIEFKVYAGVIVLGGMITFSLIKYKDLSFLKITLASVALTLGVFLPQNLRASDLLVLSPFWFIHSMIDFSDRVGWERLSLARQMAPIQGNWLKLYVTEVISLLLFIVGNLGTRFLSLFALVTLFRKKLWKDERYLLILILGAISFFVPILFIQKGNPWNTIQFFYYFIYFVALFSGVTVLSIFKNLPKFFAFSTVGLILLITPINAVVTFGSYLSTFPPARLTGGELAGLQVLKDLPDGVVLTHPFDKSMRSKFNDPFPLLVYETSVYTSAFSGKPTFVEDEIQQEVLQNDYKKRLISVTDFFKGRDRQWSEDFLRTNNIRYIYLPKIFAVSLNEEALELKKIYDNEEVIIYETTI